MFSLVGRFVLEYMLSVVSLRDVQPLAPLCHEFGTCLLFQEKKNSDCHLS